MYPAVIEVEPLENHILKLKFDNCQVRIFDMKKYLDIGRFKELKDINQFNQVKVCFDSIEWSNGLDFDPEILFEKSNKIEE